MTSSVRCRIRSRSPIRRDQIYFAGAAGSGEGGPGLRRPQRKLEYKAAKQEKNRNESRIRFLENMIKTAVVIDGTAAGDGVALFDKVTFYLEEEETEETIQLVTTLRQDALKGLISKESPVGKALLGRQVGDRVQVEVSPELKYWVEIRPSKRAKTTRAWRSAATERTYQKKERASCYFCGTQVHHLPEGQGLSG